jgi:hypothetical protein
LTWVCLGLTWFCIFTACFGGRNAQFWRFLLRARARATTTTTINQSIYLSICLAGWAGLYIFSCFKRVSNTPVPLFTVFSANTSETEGTAEDLLCVSRGVL